jgi:predicted ATPase
VLATSREPLDLDGERTRRVRSLTTEDDGPAVALFLQRADEAGATVDSARDADAIIRICRRLDGILLAIELAAARARSLRPAEIADRLDNMFHMLTGGKRASAERHRTLRATLEWSHDLLTDPERAVLARLSILIHGFRPVADRYPLNVFLRCEHGDGPPRLAGCWERQRSTGAQRCVG